MPFSGPEPEQMKAITAGKYNMKPEKWAGVSKLAKQFVGKMLIVNPEERLTAAGALEHPWIKDKAHHEEMHIDLEVVESMKAFAHASRFRKTCFSMMAWSLSAEE